MVKITSIASLANEHAMNDLQILLFTLQLWNTPAPTVYIYTDRVTDPLVKKIKYAGKIITKAALNTYTGLNRRQMESMPGAIYRTLFADFCAEKTHLMEWSIEESGGGVLFCDADICHLGALPEIPESVELALSPHLIRKRDTDLYGIYNAGFIYLKSKEVAVKWRDLCKTSRFFEQGCLEDLSAQVNPIYTFTKHTNYGWWRLYQGISSSEDLEKEWGFLRKDDTYSGLVVGGEPVLSIHTHWCEKNDYTTVNFNRWILEKLQKLTSLKKTKQLVQFIQKIQSTTLPKIEY